jgi:hypothetical protein
MFRVCGKSGGAAIEPIACGGFACGRALFRVSIRDETERLCRRWRLANPRVFVLVYQRNRGLDLARCSDVRLHDGRNGNRTFGEPLHEQAASHQLPNLHRASHHRHHASDAEDDIRRVSYCFRVVLLGFVRETDQVLPRVDPFHAPVIWAGCFCHTPRTKAGA